MDRLRCIEVFVEVASCGSFTAAAARLNMSKASVTKHIASLEHAFNARLLNRNTKRVGLTDVGASTLSRCKFVLDSFEDLESDLHSALSELKGLIKVGAPPAFGVRYMLPLIARFTDDHPGIEVSLSLAEPAGDFQMKEYDLFVGFNAFDRDSSHSFDLVRLPQVIVASPSYLDKHGTPETPLDLVNHNCLTHTQKTPNGVWRFASGVAVGVRGSLRSNHGDALRQAALLGRGISMFPYYFVEEACRTGELRILLPGHRPADLQFSAVHQATRSMPARTRKLIDYLRDWTFAAPAPDPAPTCAAPRLGPAAPRPTRFRPSKQTVSRFPSSSKPAA